MRRYDLLDEYATLIAPDLAPQARPAFRPAMRTSGTPKRWPVPVILLAVCCVLLAAI